MLWLFDYHKAIMNYLYIHIVFINNIVFILFPVAQLVEHGVSNAKIMGSILRESKSW